MTVAEIEAILASYEVRGGPKRGDTRNAPRYVVWSRGVTVSSGLLHAEARAETRRLIALEIMALQERDLDAGA